jgi:vacuolar-type H+-ATPase subunit H
MDPSIVQARERVMNAETAEREADRALESARIRVREAREEVRRLELEAKEEARRAKIKQYHAREVSKRGKQLGREYIVQDARLHYADRPQATTFKRVRIYCHLIPYLPSQHWIEPVLCQIPL